MKNLDQPVTRRELAQFGGAIFIAIGVVGATSSSVGLFFIFLGFGSIILASLNQPSQAELDYKEHLREQALKEQERPK